MDRIVGIASPYKDYNYGTVLQAYALYKILDDLGVKSEYIDYTASSSLPAWKRISRYFLHPIQLWRRLFRKQKVNPIVTFLQSDAFYANKVEYDKFIAQIPCSECYDINTIKQSDKRYSLFIVGSDQTWSPFLNDTNSLYFLNFTEDRKKNSYAPSLGTSDLSDEYKQLLKKKISLFNHVSCREHFGAQLLSDLTGKDVVEVLDPTLLLTKEDWERFELPVDSLPKHYILVYQLGTRPEIRNYAKVLSKKKSLPIVSLLTNEFTKSWESAIDGIGPAQFLWLIHHADSVVTDSFHGTMFSINFEKQFYSFTKVEGGNNRFDNIRLLDILSCYNLENRIITDINGQHPNDIDYHTLYPDLAENRMKSISYLKRIVIE